MQVITLTAKGQVTIPADIRRRLGLKPGDKVAFVEEDGKVVLVRQEHNIEAAFGLIKGKVGVSLEQMDEAVRKRAGK